MKTTIDVELEGFRETKNTLKRIEDVLVSESLDITETGMKNVARAKAGIMRGLISQRGKAVHFGAPYTLIVDKLYGFSPLGAPTNLIRVPQTHSAEKGATIEDIIRLDVVPRLMDYLPKVVIKELRKDGP